MESQTESKWKGKVDTTLSRANPEQVWPLLQDFFNLHKYFPTLSTSYGVQGTNGQAGCIRYCAGSSIPSNGSDGEIVSWCTEKLLEVDIVEMRLKYGILDGNIGFEGYVATMKVLPRVSEDGCVIEWSFEVNPIKGWSLGGMIEKYQKGLEGMARRIEECLQGDGEGK
ncbi:hypothetical protein ACHQM5_028701 [Ranunculus cassubicifolius]